jgi:putative transcriptional regulator
LRKSTFIAHFYQKWLQKIFKKNIGLNLAKYSSYYSIIKGWVMNKSEEDRKILKELGAHIRSLRLVKKMSQTKLALLLNSEKTNVSRLENGNTNPTFLTLKKVADILKVHIAELIPFHGSAKTENGVQLPGATDGAM